jgi:hypothetical protein
MGFWRGHIQPATGCWPLNHAIVASRSCCAAPMQMRPCCVKQPTLPPSAAERLYLAIDKWHGMASYTLNTTDSMCLVLLVTCYRPSPHLQIRQSLCQGRHAVQGRQAGLGLTHNRRSACRLQRNTRKKAHKESCTISYTGKQRLSTDLP